ncbi:MAG TPA: ABC transporter permease [Acidobacteriaceae bacterium]|nr:ABC transporter permease [Acidobacteriaceae bacterium]
MNRMMAIVERELRKFFRSPALMLVSMVFPLVQLIVLGNAFGGKVTNATLAVVDQDHGPQAVRVREALEAVHVNSNNFRPVDYDNQTQAVNDVRNGKVQGALIIPPEFSRRVYEKNRPQIGLVIDNTDSFVSSSFESRLADLVQALNQPDIQPRLVQQIALNIVELYPYIEYMKYLLPGSITLAIFVAVMIGGGIVYIDDKARGVHEGYLVTPITKMELVFGLNLAGALKAIGSGVVITIIGSLISGIGSVFNPKMLLLLLVLIVLTALAFITMMSFIMVRVEDPLVPRAIFGVLNTLLFFPSGAIYPIQAFPTWLKWIAWIDPFTYAVHGFKAVLLKEVGMPAIWGDMVYLLGFAAIALTGTTLLFKRTL